MTIYNAPDLNTKNRHMGEFGNLTGTWGSVTPATGAVADVYNVLIIPGGLEVWDVDIINDKLDSSATTLAVTIGYAPVNANDGPPAVPDYFSAANTLLGTAGRKAMAFQPIKFERPVYLTMTVSALAGTFAPGRITALVKGDGLGIK